jgi:hypothetical protein
MLPKMEHRKGFSMLQKSNKKATVANNFFDVKKYVVSAFSE